METSEVLYRAADLIEQRGWTQGIGFGKPDPWGHDGQGPVCLEGAIFAAEDWAHGYVVGAPAYDRCPAYQAMWSYLGLGFRETPFGLERNPLFFFNDSSETTQFAVVSALRAAAVIEAAKENQHIKQEVAA